MKLIQQFPLLNIIVALVGCTSINETVSSWMGGISLTLSQAGGLLNK